MPDVIPHTNLHDEMTQAICRWTICCGYQLTATEIEEAARSASSAILGRLAHSGLSVAAEPMPTAHSSDSNRSDLCGSHQ